MTEPGGPPFPPPPGGPPGAAGPHPLPPLPPAPAMRTHVGKYLVKRELGRGGMGAVYLAEQPGLGREVAIKELIVSAAADPSALTRFLQEAQAMARSSHPNLVQVHDMEEDGDSRFIILEFVRGRSLRDMLNDAGRVPLPKVFAVMHGVLQGLNYAHRHSIVHRDMKPENVLVSDDGDVKVADFGIARLTDDAGGGSTATRAGTTVGTPQYMSPEQVSTSKVDGRSDLYSAGIILYELVCGRPPFTVTGADGPFTLMAKHVQAPPPPPAIHRPDLDPELEQVILRALAKRPEDRFQTGAEFDDALRRVAARICPGWERALEPGADLSAMVAAPGSTEAPPLPPPTTPGFALPSIPVAPPTGALPPPVAAGPPPAAGVQEPRTAPPAPARRAWFGCLGILGMLLSGLGAAAVLAGELRP